MGAAQKVLGCDFSVHGTAQLHELGVEVDGNDGRYYRYSKAAAAIALGDVLVASVATGVNQFVPVSAADQIMMGAWPSDAVGGTARTAILINEFFWMVVKGDASVKAAATVVAGAPCVTIATAGTVDDTAATAANALAAASGVGAQFQTTTTGGLARVLFR